MLLPRKLRVRPLGFSDPKEYFYSLPHEPKYPLANRMAASTTQTIWAPKAKGLWGNPELSRELLAFSTILLSGLGIELAILSPPVANVRPLAEKSGGPARARLTPRVGPCSDRHAEPN